MDKTEKSAQPHHKIVHTIVQVAIAILAKVVWSAVVWVLEHHPADWF